ncbi:MAG TPA: hypothetical protein VGM05_26380 [Planctomycetaceae bacterium]
MYLDQFDQILDRDRIPLATRIARAFRRYVITALDLQFNEFSFAEEIRMMPLVSMAARAFFRMVLQLDLTTGVAMVDLHFTVLSM